MANAGYNCRIYITGTSTAFTTEATTNTTGNTWQITNANKRIWNPNTIPDFFDNGVAIASGDISSIDYLYGKVTFTGVKTGPITVTGAYLPMYEVTYARDFSLNLSRAMADITSFGDTAHKRQPLLMDASGDFTLQDVMNTDYESGGGTRTLKDCQDNDTAIVLSFQLSSTAANVYRVWVKITDLETSAQFDGLVETSVSWELNAVADSAGRPAYFGINDV